MNTSGHSLRYNAEAFSLESVPVLSLDMLRETVVQHTVDTPGRLLSLFACPVYPIGKLRLYAVTGVENTGAFSVVAADIDDYYPALTPDCTQAHLFEREIAEQWGVHPQDHPWLKPVRFHHAYRPMRDAWGRGPDDGDFYQVAGEEVHEVAVGPVHAGIIEPGHFRFQCHGEHVMHLEIALGYQHRGIERALVHGPKQRAIHYMETLAGDTTVGHTQAYCQAIEALAHACVPFRGEELRGIALELERLANHTGDLGALAGDVGYLPTASFCGRLRGDFLNMTALVCGNRFGRGWVRPGGTACDMTPELGEQLLQRLNATYKDVRGAVSLLWNSPSVMARFENIGAVSRETAEELGLVGVAARASGCDRDVRFEYPHGIYRFVSIPVATLESGDVFARAHVRWSEITHSVDFIRERLAALSDGPARQEPASALMPNAMTVSLVEGWRGEICHSVITDAKGDIAHYKIVDPSFHNWTGLAMALRSQQISDFPLCNKSFNLSYCGFDL